MIDTDEMRAAAYRLSYEPLAEAADMIDSLTGLLGRVASSAVRYDSRVYALTADFAALAPYVSQEDLAAAAERPSESDARVSAERDELRRRLADGRDGIRSILEQAQGSSRNIIDRDTLCDCLRDVIADLVGDA